MKTLSEFLPHSVLKNCYITLEQELKSAALEAKLDRHKALHVLWAEHQRVIDREQNLIEKRKSTLMTESPASNAGLSALNQKNLRSSGKAEDPQSQSADPEGTLLRMCRRLAVQV